MAVQARHTFERAESFGLVFFFVKPLSKLVTLYFHGDFERCFVVMRD